MGLFDIRMSSNYFSGLRASCRDMQCRMCNSQAHVRLRQCAQRGFATAQSLRASQDAQRQNQHCLQHPKAKRHKLNYVRASPRGTGASLEETIALDGLIDTLLKAKSQTEIVVQLHAATPLAMPISSLKQHRAFMQLGKCVADNFLAFDQKFWMRLASRSDSASSPEDRDRIGGLAGQVMRMVEALVKKSDSQITDSASVLQKIIAAAADEKGEWHLPLSDDNVASMKQELEKNSSNVDESLLATANAWMRKAAEDKLDGTVALLQQFLQLYAGGALTEDFQPQDADDRILKQVLALRETQWLPTLEAEVLAGRINESSFLTAVRRMMEQTVLTLPSGSNAQRIQAEYLKEVESRAETFFKQA